MKKVATVAGDVDVWETPVGWRFAPVGHEDPESFSDHYPSEAAAVDQAHLWAADEGDEE